MPNGSVSEKDAVREEGAGERERLAAMLDEWAEARDEDARLSDPLGNLRDETIRIARDLRRAAALLREPRNSPEIPDSSPREAPAAEPGDEARRVAGAFMDEMLEICARAEGFDSYAACDWSPEGLMEWRDRLAALLASPAAERITPDALDGLDAVIEGEAVAFMEAWKAARFKHAGDFARQLAVRVVEVMREDTPTPAPTLADGETCDACGHVGRLHYRDRERARTHGCMARVDSAYTVSNDRACGCHRLRVSEVQPTTSPEAEP